MLIADPIKFLHLQFSETNRCVTALALCVRGQFVKTAGNSFILFEKMAGSHDTGCIFDGVYKINIGHGNREIREREQEKER